MQRKNIAVLWKERKINCRKNQRRKKWATFLADRVWNLKLRQILGRVGWAIVLSEFSIEFFPLDLFYEWARELVRVLVRVIWGFKTLPTIIKLVTCCMALLVGDISEDFVKVLEKLKSFGVEMDWIRVSLSDKSWYKWKQIFEMLHFLDATRGTFPCFLRSTQDSFLMNLGRIFVFLLRLKLGLSREEILLFFEQYPRVLTGNFSKNLWRSVQFLSEIGMEKKKNIASIVSKHAQLFWDLLTVCSPKLYWKT